MESRYPGDLERLLARCRSGDEAAWLLLFERFSGFLYNLCRREGLEDDDAKDVVMSTFGVLVRNLDRIQSGLALPSWLAQTSVREARRVRRSSNRYENSAESDLNLEEIIEADDISAEQEAIKAGQFAMVQFGMQKLDTRCRRLLSALYIAEQTSYIDLASELGLPIGSIGPTRARCLEKLRKILKTDGFFSE